MNNKGIRKQNLDIIRALCAFMVVTIHCPSIFLRPYIEASVRIAVPMFFAISGYFYNKPTVSSTLKKISRLLVLLFASELLYACMYILGGQGDKVRAAVDNGILNILRCSFVLWGPGWFLLALCYTYVLAFIAERARISSSILATAALILTVILWLNPNDINNYMIFLRGIPGFIVGMLIRRHEARLSKIPVKTYVIAALLFETVVLAEKYINIHMDRNPGSTIYLGTVPIVALLFCIALFHETFNAPFLIFTGRNLSMYIYCLHVAVMSVLSRLSLEYESLWLCVISTAAAIAVYYSLNKPKSLIEHIKALPEQLEELYGFSAARPAYSQALPAARTAENRIYADASSASYNTSPVYPGDNAEQDDQFEEQAYKVG